MGEVLGRCKPVVVPVNVGDRDARQIFFRHSLEAPQIDPIHLTGRRLGADAERTDATVLAKVVLVLPGVEQVLCQLRLTRQETKSFRLRDRGPEACSPADRAVAAIGALREIEIGLELDHTTVQLPR